MCFIFELHLRDKSITVEPPIPTKLFVKGKRQCFERITKKCSPSLSKKESSQVDEVGLVDEIGMLGSISPVPNEMCFTSAVDEFELSCSMFLCIAMEISERFCMELL